MKIEPEMISDEAVFPIHAGAPKEMDEQMRQARENFLNNGEKQG